jgi:hypothetical protein
MNEEIARGMVCFFHQKKHSYLICIANLPGIPITLSGKMFQTDVVFVPYISAVQASAALRSIHTI